MLTNVDSVFFIKNIEMSTFKQGEKPKKILLTKKDFLSFKKVSIRD